MDGVLCDLVDLHKDALNKALMQFGYVITEKEHIEKYNGLPTRIKLRMLHDEKGLPDEYIGKIKEMKQQYTVEYVEKYVKLDPVKTEMVRLLRENEFTLACCSNAVQETVNKALVAMRLSQDFEVMLGNDVGFSSKPSPEIYLEAIKRLKKDPKEVIIVEDSTYGKLGAYRTGAHVIEVNGYEDVNINLFKSFIQ